MRRKIDRVLWVVESVNVQIDFDPITFITLTRAHALARAKSLTVNQTDFIRTVAA